MAERLFDLGNGQPADGALAFGGLVFRRTAGYGYDSILEGIAAVQELGTAHGI